MRNDKLRSIFNSQNSLIFRNFAIRALENVVFPNPVLPDIKIFCCAITAFSKKLLKSLAMNNFVNSCSLSESSSNRSTICSDGIKLTFLVVENKPFSCKLSREKVHEEGLRIVMLIVFGAAAGSITICMRSLLGQCC